MHPALTTALDVAERILKLIRPRFYNRLTWVVVGSGLLLAAAPWWSELVSALAQKYFAVSLPIPQDHSGLGVGLVAAGLLYHIITHSIFEVVTTNRQAVTEKAYGDHDRRMFSGLHVFLSEQELLGILQEVATCHHYWSAQGSKISGYIDYLRAPSTRFITSVVASAAEDLALKLATLRTFMSLNFCEYNSPANGDMRFCLFPDGNMDRSRGIPSAAQSKRYDTLAEELERYVCDVENAYTSFRATIKRSLAV